MEAEEINSLELKAQTNFEPRVQVLFESQWYKPSFKIKDRIPIPKLTVEVMFEAMTTNMNGKPKVPAYLGYQEYNINFEKKKEWKHILEAVGRDTI